MPAAGLDVGERLRIADQAERLVGRRLGRVVARDRRGLEITGVVGGRKIVFGVDQACRRGPLPGVWIRMTGHSCKSKCYPPMNRGLARGFRGTIREAGSAAPRRRAWRALPDNP